MIHNPAYFCCIIKNISSGFIHFKKNQISGLRSPLQRKYRNEKYYVLFFLLVSFGSKFHFMGEKKLKSFDRIILIQDFFSSLQLSFYAKIY